MAIDKSFLGKLRTMGLIEGISTLVLFFVAMPLKYFAGMPLAVTIVGSLHGLLFVLLVGMIAVGVWKIPLPPWLAAAGVVGAVVPGGPFIVDRWLGKLARRGA